MAGMWVWCFLARGAFGAEALPDEVAGRGFVSVAPPNPQLVPGAVVAVRESDAYALTVVCSADQTVGSAPAVVQDQRSRRVSRALEGETRSAGARVLARARAVAPVTDVSVRLTDVRVVHLESEAAREAMDQNRDPECRARIAAHLAAVPLVPLTFVTTAIVADVTVNITLDGSVPPEEVDAAVGAVAAALGLERADRSGTSLRWENASLGVDEDWHLAVYEIPWLPKDPRDSLFPGEILVPVKPIDAVGP